MANPTTNFGWQMPTSTDLVTDLPADFEVFGQAVDTALVDLKGGTTGQVLAKASNTNMDFAWVAQDDSNAIQNAIVDAKGDLIAASGADTPARLAVGADGETLVADSSTETGLSYAARATLAGNTFTADQTINNLTIGEGGGSVLGNTALGRNAMQDNTTGNRNVAVGNFALGDNTTGTQNNALGLDAMRLNTTGTANNAFGDNAMAANTTGGTNTAMGNFAMAANTVGSNNVAIGGDSMRYNTTGSSNTLVGFDSGNVGTTRTENTGVGRGALYNSNGNSNTAIGYDAGSLTTSGTNNTSIGAFSSPSSNTVSNTITLGNSSISTLRCQVTSITSLSDERDKTEIVPLKHGLDFVKQLKPVSFEWNTRPETHTDYEGNKVVVQGKVGIADIGFIAQDIVALEDSLDAANSLQLSYRDNPEKLEVTQGRLIPILVKAIQDLTAKVEALEAGR